MPTPKSVSPLLKVVVRAYVLGELDRDKPRVRAAVVAGRKLLSVHHSHFVFSGVFFVMYDAIDARSFDHVSGFKFRFCKRHVELLSVWC